MKTFAGFLRWFWWVLSAFCTGVFAFNAHPNLDITTQMLLVIIAWNVIKYPSENQL